MNQKDPSHIHQLAKVALDRLERISADSTWAHRASGVRASIAKALSRGDVEGDEFRELLESGFLILEKAAEEFPEE